MLLAEAGTAIVELVAAAAGIDTAVAAVAAAVGIVAAGFARSWHMPEDCTVVDCPVEVSVVLDFDRTQIRNQTVIGHIVVLCLVMLVCQQAQQQQQRRPKMSLNDHQTVLVHAQEM